MASRLIRAWVAGSIEGRSHISTASVVEDVYIYIYIVPGSPWPQAHHEIVTFFSPLLSSPQHPIIYVLFTVPMAPTVVNPVPITGSVLTSTGAFIPLSSSVSSTNSESSDYSAAHSYRGYDHVHWLVGNAKQAAAYYITTMGFYPLAYRGLETGHRTIASHVVSNGDVVFVFSSPLKSPNARGLSQAESNELRMMSDHMVEHGDGVWDVAFEVDDVNAVYRRAVENGGKVVKEPWTERAKGGEVVMAKIRTYGDTVHTLIERRRWHGEYFLPGFGKPRGFGMIGNTMLSTVGVGAKEVFGLPKIELEVIDHCVGNQDWDSMDEACD